MFITVFDLYTVSLMAMSASVSYMPVFNLQEITNEKDGGHREASQDGS
jgi:hypothetical protein